ncbi:MAG: hypothetical protein AVDCRST_MAG40-1641, partial [uncultured Gemmatimonadaceae bacterium]
FGRLAARRRRAQVYADGRGRRGAGRGGRVRFRRHAAQVQAGRGGERRRGRPREPLRPRDRVPGDGAAGRGHLRVSEGAARHQESRADLRGARAVLRGQGAAPGRRERARAGGERRPGGRSDSRGGALPAGRRPRTARPRWPGRRLLPARVRGGHQLPRRGRPAVSTGAYHEM